MPILVRDDKPATCLYPCSEQLTVYLAAAVTNNCGSACFVCSDELVIDCLSIFSAIVL